MIYRDHARNVILLHYTNEHYQHYQHDALFFWRQSWGQDWLQDKASISKDDEIEWADKVKKLLTVIEAGRVGRAAIHPGRIGFRASMAMPKKHLRLGQNLSMFLVFLDWEGLRK